MFEPAANVDERGGRVAQSQEVATQHVEALRIGLVEDGIEHSVLDRLDLIVDRLHHRHVVVDDEVEDGVEDVVLAVRQDGRARLAAPAYRRI